jgi:pyruvate/2-oxoacid:ferredoxin oxidoreductase alpha subunit
MIQGLWIPKGATYHGVVPLGMNNETGGQIVSHSFVLKAKDKFGVEHSTRIEILADDSMSQNQIEEMMGNSAEAFLKEVRTKYDKRPATPREIKDIGKALNDFRISVRKRLASTNRKVYY